MTVSMSRFPQALANFFNRLRRWTTRLFCNSIPHEIEAFVLPPFDPTDHLLYFSSKPGQIHGRAIGTVAVRTAAIYDEQSIGRVGGQVPLVDPAGWRINGPGDVSSLELLRSPTLQE